MCFSSPRMQNRYKAERSNSRRVISPKNSKFRSEDREKSREKSTVSREVLGYGGLLPRASSAGGMVGTRGVLKALASATPKAPSPPQRTRELRALIEGKRRANERSGAITPITDTTCQYRSDSDGSPGSINRSRDRCCVQHDLGKGGRGVAGAKACSIPASAGPRAGAGPPLYHSG